MSLRLAQALTLLGATATMGLVAGVFGLYAHTIMRGLHKTDDRTFVGAFQAIDRAIINPLFMSTFFGALLLTGAAALLHLKDDVREVLPWLVVAAGLYLVVVVITIAVNVPLNDDIKAAGDPATIDVAAVRDNFHEARWVAWNVVRTVATTAAFLCLCWSLVLHGRETAEADRPDSPDRPEISTEMAP
ncbi:MAG TPA: anthrone oxygenase family protein [Acidimicrobiales bacterium]|nr:anthrone oxygenase family protein [Acidimicrobiales bacterium]